MATTDTTLDVIVIGAGPGGYICAIRAAQNGLKVAVVEKDDRPGGTCLLRGCIPTKALLESAHVLEQTKHANDFGILADMVRFDWGGVNKFKDKVVAKNANGVKFLFKKNGIEHVIGTARITGPGALEVAQPDGTKRAMKAKHIVLATGSATRHLPSLAKVDGRRVFTSDELLQIEDVPKSMIVVGAGAVGVEFASVFSRFGTQATIVEMAPRLIPLEDEEVSAEFEKIIRRKGIKSHTGTAVKSVDVREEGVEVRLEKDGKSETLQAETILLAIGRRPVTDGLGLENVRGVKLDKGYIVVDNQLRTGESWLSAIGDVVTVGGAPHPQLAHVASAEGVLVADRLAGKHVTPIDYERGIIGATYSEPEVASVGLTEAKAREKYGKVKIGKFPYAAIGKSSVIGAPEGFIKLVAAEKHDELLGMHIIGAKATELIHEGLIALKLESTSEEIAHAIHAHPTLGEGIMEAAHAVLGKAMGA